MKKLTFFSLYLFLVFSYQARGQEALEEMEVPAKPDHHGLWIGTEFLGWLNNGADRTFLTPELALKYPVGEMGAFNLITGYHVVWRDSLFNNIHYKNRGWFIKAGPELLIPVSYNGKNFFVLGANLVYSRFREEARVSFQYEPGEFNTRLNPANTYSFKAVDSPNALAVEFPFGVWFTRSRFSWLFTAHISFLLKEPENKHMAVHYVPGIGIRTPQYDFIFRNTNNTTNDVFPGVRFRVFYRLY